MRRRCGSNPNPNLTLTRYESIAAKQPLFRAWRADLLQKVVKSADGTPHRVYERALAEARSPSGVGDSQPEVKAVLVELAEAMAEQALYIMRDSKRAIADKLTSQQGANAVGKSATAHANTLGAHDANDRVESNFGGCDAVTRMYRYATTENIAGMVQQMRNHDLDREPNVAHDRGRTRKDGGEGEAAGGGFFWRGLTHELRRSLVEFVRLAAPRARADGRLALKEHDEAKLERREERVQALLTAAVEHYAHALELFDAWMVQRAKSKQEVERCCKDKPEAQVLEYLRLQIEMRVLGCGWEQFTTRWSSNKDSRIGTAAHLKGLLEEIILEEKSLERLGRLPTEAAPPHHKVTDLGQLGSVNADALAIERKALFSTEELRAKAEEEKQRRVEAGVWDTVERLQPNEAPAFDQALMGKRLEVLWKYMNKDTNEPVLVWATGRVARVADGLTDKRSRLARKVLPAGAILWAWEADPEFDEAAGEQWLVLLPKKWNKQQQYSWRFDPRELGAAPNAQQPARPANLRRCEA